MNGILLIKKPKGMTSFQAVSSCKRKMHEKKAGHSGTLDPEAEGLMIVALGKCTKLLPYVVSNHKHYIATFSLGKRFDTQDAWGTCIEEKTYRTHDAEELESISQKMTGHIRQIPPMYSALKKDGKKLYEYARKGIEVERQARDAEISSLSVQQIAENSFRMDALVSSGTYIRTLIEDYCSGMNELGYMTSLVRVGIEHLTLDDACELEEVSEEKCMDPLRLIDHAWKLLETDAVEDIKNGKTIRINTDEKRVILIHGNEILAAYERMDNGYYHCVRGLF